MLIWRDPDRARRFVKTGLEQGMRTIKAKNGGTLVVAEKGESGNPKGRPRIIFTQLAEEWKKNGVQRATPARVVETYEFLLGLTDAEIQEIADGTDETNKYPVIVRIAAKELTGNRRQDILERMLDRAHGKAVQRQELSGPDGEPLPVQTVVFSIQYRDPNADDTVNAVSDAKEAKQTQSKESTKRQSK